MEELDNFYTIIPRNNDKMIILWPKNFYKPPAAPPKSNNWSNKSNFTSEQIEKYLCDGINVHFLNIPYIRQSIKYTKVNNKK